MSSLDKLRAKLAKLEAKKEALISGKPIVKSAASAASTAQKALEKARREFLKNLTQDKNEFLETETIYCELEDRKKIRQNTLQNARIALENYQALALAELNLFIVKVKAQVSEVDIDNLVDAEEAWQDFQDAVQEHFIACVANNVVLDEDELCGIYDNLMTEKRIAVLTRPTDIFWSIDYLADQVRADINNGSFHGWQASLTEKINTLLEKYQVGLVIG